MKLYKSPTNEIYAYETNGSQDSIIPSNYTPITKQEAESIISASIVVTAESQRQKRDTLLQQSDWTQLPDAPINNKEAWATYRQILRDITTQSGFPESLIWPTKP